jgi:hypothetical protein
MTVHGLEARLLLLLLLLPLAAVARKPVKPSGPPPISCDVSRNGGCFDLSIDGQQVRQLDTPDGTATYQGVDYLKHTRNTHMWYAKEPVSAQPKFVLRTNAHTAEWLQGETCLDVIIEAANAQTYHAQRFAIPDSEGACKRQAANARVDGRGVMTVDTSERADRLPPGNYVAFVYAYGSVHGFDKKDLFFTVAEPAASP